MAKIKGITIEIGGNTQPLNKALSDVNKKSRDLQSELRQVEKLLKLDPENTELLAQKQKLLAEAVQNSSEKLNRLKTAQQQVNEQFRKGEISEEQYRAFQREVVKAEQELEKFEKQLRETGITAEQVGKKLQDAGQKMTGIGKDLSMKVTAPVLAIGAAATKLGMDFEAAMSEVGAISGATGEELEALEAKAKELGATTKFSATEAAEGLKYMAMAGWDVQQQLDGLPGVLSLAAASGESLGAVSDIVTDAMTAFGMEAARAAEFADILAAASSNANTNVGMLGESFKYVAPVAGALGYEAKDVAIGLGLMANAGIKASQAGTAMRSMLTRLVKPTKESGTAMDTLGISITDSEGKMKSFAQIMDDLRGAFQKLDPDQQAFYAAQIAGQEAMSGLLAIVNASEADYAKLSDAINNSAGAAQRMAKEMQDNLKGRLTELKSAIEGVALQLYDHLQPALEKIVGVVQKLVDWFADLSPETQKVIVVIAGLAAVIGPLLIVLGAMASGLSAIIGILPVLGAALTTLTGPIGIAIAAITALIAIGVLLCKNCDEIKAKAKEAWDGVKDNFALTGRIIKDMLIQLKDNLVNTWNNIKSATVNIWSNIKTAITSPIESAKQTVLNIIDRIKSAFANMKITIPKPKLPHISVNWRSIGVGDAKIKIPDFDLNWYKAGGIFNRPSIIGVGEAGTEAVIPLDKMPGLIADALRDAMGGGQVAMAGGITVQNMYVRNDNDIKLIARELYNLQQTNARGRGLK